VKTGERGEIIADEYQRTANPRIWTAGDVTGGPQFVYTASAQVPRRR
jgi:mercuric reductase